MIPGFTGVAFQGPGLPGDRFATWATWESLAPGWSQPDSIAVFELTSESFFWLAV